MTTDHEDDNQEHFLTLAHVWNYWAAQATYLLFDIHLAKQTIALLPTLSLQDVSAIRDWIDGRQPEVPAAVNELYVQLSRDFRRPKNWRDHLRKIASIYGTVSQPILDTCLKQAMEEAQSFSCMPNGYTNHHQGPHEGQSIRSS